MRLLATAVGLSLLGSLGGLLLGSTLLLFRDRVRAMLIPWLISYAVGILLSVALMALLPRALELLRTTVALGTLLAGIITFFVLEKLVLWRHCHTHECAAHGGTASLVLIGDAVHTFADGALIAAAVWTSVPLGLSTALAAAAHEIPQEVGDFAILLGAGYSRARAFLLNVLAGTSAVAGAVAGVVAIDRMPSLLPYLLVFAASGFLYVAMADLMPDLHRGRIDAKAFRQLLLVGAGIVTALMI